MPANSVFKPTDICSICEQAIGDHDVHAQLEHEASAYLLNRPLVTDSIPMNGIPAEFGLRAFPGRVFRVGQGSYRNDAGIWMYYLECQAANGEWLSFAKGTRSELFHEMIKF